MRSDDEQLNEIEELRESLEAATELLGRCRAGCTFRDGSLYNRVDAFLADAPSCTEPGRVVLLNPESVGNPELTPEVELSDDLADMLVASGQCAIATSLAEAPPAPTRTIVLRNQAGKVIDGQTEAPGTECESKGCLFIDRGGTRCCRCGADKPLRTDAVARGKALEAMGAEAVAALVFDEPAPTRTNGPGCCPFMRSGGFHGEDCADLGRGHCTPPRTDHERAVLETMGQVEIVEYNDRREKHVYIASGSKNEAAAKAEIARREAEK